MKHSVDLWEPPPALCRRGIGMGGNRPDAEFFRRDRPRESERRIAERLRAPLPPGIRERKLRFLFPLRAKPSNTAKRMSEEAFRMQSFPCSGATRIFRGTPADFALFIARKPDRSIFYYTTNERYLANVFHEIMRAP